MSTALPGSRRLLSAVCVLLTGAALAPSVASAHVGQPSVVVAAGRYRVVVAGGPVPADRGAALALHGTLSSRMSGFPVTAASARLRIVVANPGGGLRGDYRASVFDGSYSLLVPIPDPDTWRSLRYTFVVAGPLGAASGRYRPPDLFGEWSLDPVVLALAALAAACFVQGFVRLRRRGRRDLASFPRLGLFGTGLALTVLALVSPLDAVGDGYLLSVHMLQHVVIGDLAPALMIVSLRGPLLFFLLPRRAMAVLGRARWLRRAARSLRRPIVVLAVWVLAYGCWHVPVAYDYADGHRWLHDLEHTSFVAAGFLLWNLLVDPARHGGLSRGRRLALAAAVLASGTVIADVLIFSMHPLYPLYAGQLERVFSLSAVRDQQLAGLIMAVEQLLTLGTLAVLLVLPGLRRGGSRAVVGAAREGLA